MDKYFFFKKNAMRPFEEQRLLAKPLYQHVGEIYAHYDDWKDDRRVQLHPPLH